MNIEQPSGAAALTTFYFVLWCCVDEAMRFYRLLRIDVYDYTTSQQRRTFHTYGTLYETVVRMLCLPTLGGLKRQNGTHFA